MMRRRGRGSSGLAGIDREVAAAGTTGVEKNGHLRSFCSFRHVTEKRRGWSRWLGALEGPFYCRLRSVRRLPVDKTDGGGTIAEQGRWGWPAGLGGHARTSG